MDVSGHYWSSTETTLRTQLRTSSSMRDKKRTDEKHNHADLDTAIAIPFVYVWPSQVNVNTNCYSA